MTIHDPEVAEMLGLPVAVPNMESPVPVSRLLGTGDNSQDTGDNSQDTMIAGDSYEAASQLARELSTWNPRNRSADGDIAPAKAQIEARANDTMRNDAYVQGGATLHKDNIVGSLYALNAKPFTKIVLGKEDDKWEEEFQEEVETKFTLDAESPKCWLDASRTKTLTEMIRMVVGMFVPVGEAAASVEWMRDEADIRPCATAIQLIDTQRISTPPEYSGDKNVRMGVRRNANGAPQGYYVRMAHPSDWTRAESFDWKYVPAALPWGRPQMIHIFEQLRCDQTRGISEMVSALKEMRITKKFRDIVLQNAIVNATYAASIESDLDTNAIFARLGGGNLATDADWVQAMNGYMVGHLSNIKQYMGDSKHFQIDGVKIPHLPPGSKLHMQPAGKNGPLGTDFETSLLRYIAANLGVSYEQLSRDYTKTNYSSARAAMTETWKFMQSRKKFVADRFANIVYRLWLEEMLNKRDIESMPQKFRNGDMSWLYAPRILEAVSRATWIGASRGQIDELKETQAAVLRGKYNLGTDEDELAKLGLDFRTVYKQRAREKNLREKLGIETMEESNAMNAASGAPRQKEAKSEKSDGSEKNASKALEGGTLEQMFFDRAADPVEAREEADA